MRAVRVLGALGLSMIIGLCVVLLLSPVAIRPVHADDGPPPRTRANAPEVLLTIYVDRVHDTSVTACTSAPNDCTLRGAIDKANSDPANIYTILFSPTVDVVAPLSPLPTITANDLWIIGINGTPRIDALLMSAGYPFTINATRVKIAGLSIVNGENFGDIAVLGGTQNEINNNYLGLVPTAVNCSSGGVIRNTLTGVYVNGNATGSSNVYSGSVYIYNNTIGCHETGITIRGADYVHIGEQPGGFSGGNYIGVNASGLVFPNTSHGIYFLFYGSTDLPRHGIIANNVIAGNGGDGIHIDGSGTPNTNSAYNNVIRANRIGVGPTGARVPNGGNGVYIGLGAFQNFIGGTSDADRNIISGNADHGVWITNSLGIGVLGNYIGTNVTGTAAISNGLGGVKITAGDSNIIGGAIYGIFPATKGNLIQYNAGDGVQLFMGAHDNLVVANDIRYNTLSGVGIASGAYDNIVGGDVITSLNILGNNGSYGVYLHGNTTTGNVVKYNDILNNGIDGVTLQADAHDNEIGGSVPNAFNLIRYNNGSGIWVNDSGPNTISYNGIVGNQYYGVILDGSATQGTIISHTTIAQNGYDGIGERNGAGANFWNRVSIFGNGGLGIDKEASSDTANIINAPTLTIDSVNRSTGVVRGHATGSLLLVIDEIELYRVELDPSGYGEGKTFVGSAVTDADGNWQIVDPSPGSGCYTAFESLVVVVPLGSSEFSRTSCRTMLPAVLK
ncbi:MAG TPA: right-handed parallel beta-helix repeat-containing protein [Anaerolineae bacterium]|nr:right-handed parallel beta-helix repeat-containing protein [Anaerolineae bacterium]